MVIARVFGMSWKDFVQQRILTPLGMTPSASCYYGASKNANIINAHRIMDDSLRVITGYSSMKDDAAGRIYCNISNISIQFSN